MLRSLFLAAALTLSASAAEAQTTPTRKSGTKPKKPAQTPPAKDEQTPSTSTKTGEQGAAAAPATAGSGGAAQSAAQGGSPPPTTTPSQRTIDQEEFRRQVMEEVRRELQKTKDEVKQETAFGTKEMKFKADEAAVVVGGELALLINKSGTVKILSLIHI